MSLIQVKGVKLNEDQRGQLSVEAKFFLPGSSLDDAWRAKLPAVTSLPYIRRTVEDGERGSLDHYITAYYGGLITEPAADGSQDQWEITEERREEAIEAFPFRDQLKKQYGAYEDPITNRLKFPEFLKASGGNGGLKSGNGNATGEKNPLYGVTSYPVLYAVAKHTCVRFSVPADWWEKVHSVIKQLPDGFRRFNYPQGKPWVVDPMLVRRVRNSVTIQRQWREIDKLKHLEALQLLLSARR